MTGSPYLSDRAVGIIPARLHSTRLPRKPLIDICGLPMILHVYRRCSLAKSLRDVFVATDSNEIRDIVQGAGGKVIMTRADHETGTDRIAEAARHIDCDIIANIQGDEALVNPLHIDHIVNTMKRDPAVNCAMLVCPLKETNVASHIKVVLNNNNDVMYLSRSDIPSSARTPSPKMLKAYHIIPFRKKFLLDYAGWPKGELERVEYNEYLRILEKGHKIKAFFVESDAISVDTQQDLAYVRAAMQKDPFFSQYN